VGVRAVIEELRRENLRLSQVNRQLEERLAQLRRANAELARACQFTSEFCHELRAPLASIIAYAELLQEGAAGPLTPAQQEYVDGIVEQGHELLSSMNDILDLARIEAGRMEVRTAPLRLSDVIVPLVKRMEPRARRKGISLHVDLGGEGIPVVEADRQKVERVLCNILDNAIKFTPPGGEIWLEVAWCPPAEVVVAVRDNGPGIPEEEQEAIFERYYRARDRGDGTGAGLGLSLARQLVELQGGRIWVESQPGKGATFYVALPVQAGRR
jgi:signal transduction histidine kinase